MSMVFCITCGEMRDSDAEPEGFYTLKFPDDYVCDECREKHDIRTQFDEGITPSGGRMSGRTQLQREIMENSQTITREMEISLKKCNTRHERDQCKKAYYALHDLLEGAIMQRHGLPAKQRKASPPTPVMKEEGR